MVTRFGEKEEVKNRVYFDFPTPKKLFEKDIEEIKRCGLSWRKADYIKGVAKKVARGEFDSENLLSLSNEQAVNQLKEFRGVGMWTAEMVLAAGLKRDYSSCRGFGSEKNIFKSVF